MDAEKSGEVLDVSETQKPDETVMEREGKFEKTEESTEPENPAAAVDEAEPLAVNGHAAEVESVKEPEVSVVAEKVEDSLEKADKESEPSVVAPPESAESSEKIPEPVAALDAKPENTEPQTVPENKPEPLQMHLAESSPEPEPEKPAESVPKTEPEEKTLPAPAVVEQPVEPQPPSQEEKKPEPAKPETELPAAMEAEPIKEAAVETVVVEKEVSSEAATVKVASAQAEGEEPVKDPKEATPDPESAVKAEAVKSEQKDAAEPQKEEDAAPASGSLSFTILEEEETKNALRVSRTLVVLRGLPGSGKSFLARAIADSYKEQCFVFCADSHGIKPENSKSSTDGYKNLDDAVVARCSEGPTSSVLIVVDDTNHTHDRLARLGEIAEEHNLVALFLEPQTDWSRDVTQLKKKTSRELEESHLEAMKSPLEETSLPLFFGWFLLSPAQDKVRCTAMDFLKTLDTLEIFKKHLADFTGKAEEEVDLEQFFKAASNLHCTTKFCDYGKADGAKEYAQNPAVKKSYGSVFELSLTALFVTPRTVGARVSLNEQQLQLWPADAEKEAESAVPAAASLPPGSRAHVTLGCAEGVEPVQTGLDLLQILSLQQGDAVQEMELGSLRYYGEGRWMLDLREPISALACFSSFYRHKEVDSTKKVHEKKKKLKCSIL